MTLPTEGGPLPTPAQMRAFYGASFAAWRARQMREASRAIITGIIAFGFCLLGTTLVLLSSNWMKPAGPFIACGLLLGYFVGLILSVRWMRRRRDSNLVKVIDRREEQVRSLAAKPWKVVPIFLASIVCQIFWVIVWNIAFRHMSNSAILISVSICPFIGILVFVRRLAAFQFWEDLLFAASIAMAWAPFLLQDWNLTPLSFVSLFLVVIGTVFMNYRWVTWTRSLVEMGIEETAEGVQS